MIRLPFGNPPFFQVQEIWHDFLAEKNTIFCQHLFWTPKTHVLATAWDEITWLQGGAPISL